MSTLPPSTPKRTTGLSPKEQKLQALRDKLAKANGTATAKPAHAAGGQAAKVPSGPARKANFQRKAT